MVVLVENCRIKSVCDWCPKIWF